MRDDTPAATPNDQPTFALERLDDTLRRRADRSRLRARLGLLVVAVGVLATITAFVLPGTDGSLFSSLMAAGPGLLGALIGTAVTVGARRRFARFDGLRRAGVLARGRVRSLEPRGPGRGWSVTFEFQDARGQLHRAASEPLPEPQARSWTAGTVGLLLYDPGSPSQPLWLGIRSPSSGA